MWHIRIQRFVYSHKNIIYRLYQTLFATLTRWKVLLFDAMICFHDNPFSLVYGTLYFIWHNVVFFHLIDLIWSYFKFLLLALTIHVGTESEISFSLMSGVGKNNRRGRESMSITSASAKLLPNPKPVRIAAINGKPRVQRYLSRECKFLFLFTSYFWHFIFLKPSLFNVTYFYFLFQPWHHQ